MRPLQVPPQVCRVIWAKWFRRAAAERAVVQLSGRGAREVADLLEELP